MTTVACVLKTGGDFRPEHAARLYDQFLRHAPPEVGFACLTDAVDQVAELNVPTIPLEHDWPGWWSKIEAFHLPEPTLYLDLDTNIVGDLTPLLDAASQHEFIMCRGFWGVDDPNHVNSSVMGWRSDVSFLYREFASAPTAYMDVYKARTKWGDQAFVRDHWRGEIALWQDVLPGVVQSFKRDVLMGSDWSDAKVIASHGQPRPWGPGGADAWLARRERVA